MKKNQPLSRGKSYSDLFANVASLLEAGRTSAVWTLNTIMAAVYWEIGRRIILFEQAGRQRADYGGRVIELLSADLKKRFGSGFGRSTLFQIRAFYLAFPSKGKALFTSHKKTRSPRKNQIVQTLSGQLGPEYLIDLKKSFPLSWSHYTLLISIADTIAREFYETEALRNGWSVRQLERQIGTSFFERTALSRNKAAMLEKGASAPGDLMNPELAIKDPYILEFLHLKDEYSETDLENALIHKLEDFLMELGGDFAFIGRQKRLRIGDEWYRIDLLFFHRRLRCLIVIDLKVGKFSHADAGQMHLYLNYAREHWTLPGENPPVGLILCSQKNSAVAKYALEGLPNKILASEYRLALPDEDILRAQLARARTQLENPKR